MTIYEIIRESLDAYVPDPVNLRATDGDGGCEYHMFGAGGYVRMCAFGRCCQNPQLMPKGTPVSALPCEVDCYLKPEYCGQEPEFWQDIQRFHDVDDNWTKEGLSRRGVTNLYGVVRRWLGEHNTHKFPELQGFQP
jgi:hypothetical protein